MDLLVGHGADALCLRRCRRAAAGASTAARPPQPEPVQLHRRACLHQRICICTCAGAVLILVSAALLLSDTILRAAALAVEDCAPGKGRL